MQGRDAYEFTGRENETIGKASKWARALAGASIVMVIVHLVFAFTGGTDFAHSGIELIFFDVGAGIASAVCYLAAGVLFGLAAAAFHRVVTTEGRDLTNMLQALDTLHRVFVVRIALAFLTVIAVAAVIAIGEGF